DTWKIQKVDAITSLGSWVGYLSGLDFDSAGNPHISYEDAGALKHAYWDGKSWRIQLLVGAGVEPYRFSSLGIGSHDDIYISYRDPQDGSLKVAIGHPSSGTSSANALPALGKRP